MNEKRCTIKEYSGGVFLKKLLLSTLQAAALFDRSHHQLKPKAQYANVAFTRRVVTMFNDSFCDRSDSQAVIALCDYRLIRTILCYLSPLRQLSYYRFSRPNSRYSIQSLYKCKRATYEARLLKQHRHYSFHLLGG
jgi:hypothetical protein